MLPSHTQNSQARFIYRLCRPADWARARKLGRFCGSADDARDGFIHFSTAGQLAETARRHYASERALVLVEVDARDLGADLRWEVSRGGALFPHLYAPLDLTAVRRVRAFRHSDNGNGHAG